MPTSRQPSISCWYCPGTLASTWWMTRPGSGPGPRAESAASGRNWRR
jgi:hypothetical protein